MSVCSSKSFGRFVLIVWDFISNMNRLCDANWNLFNSVIKIQNVTRPEKSPQLPHCFYGFVFHFLKKEYPILRDIYKNHFTNH